MARALHWVVRALRDSGFGSEEGVPTLGESLPTCVLWHRGGRWGGGQHGLPQGCTCPVQPSLPVTRLGESRGGLAQSPSSCHQATKWGQLQEVPEHCPSNWATESKAFVPKFATSQEMGVVALPGCCLP